MNKYPSKLVAVLICIVSPPLAMLYLTKMAWASAYLVLALAIGFGGMFLMSEGVVSLGLQLLFVICASLHVLNLIGKHVESSVRPRYSRWYGLLGVWFGIFSFFFLVRSFVVEPFRVPSKSMTPTLVRGAILIVEKWGYGNYGAYGYNLTRRTISSPLARGDIIVFEFPNDRAQSYVHRLIALPGDAVEYRNRELSVNGLSAGRRQLEDYVDSESLEVRQAFVETLFGREYQIHYGEHDTNKNLPLGYFPLNGMCEFFSDGFKCKVPHGHYFVLGDNRDNSHDSRIWGFLPSSHIVGKVIHVSKN